MLSQTILLDIIETCFIWKIRDDLRTFGTKYSRPYQVEFAEDCLENIWGDIVCLSRPYIPSNFL